MATNRIRTLEFLPEIFRTPTNAEFLGATLDQLVNPPVTQRIQGYVGSRVGYGVNAKDYYVTEPTKIRRDYQLDPGVIFTKKNESKAQDFISYPGIIDGLKLEGAVTNNNNRLFESQFYSWDSFTNLDKIINFNQYYWLPDGPPAVTVAAATVFTTNDYFVTDLANGYNIRTAGSGAGSINPTLTLLRGGTYRFTVNQASQFWIQAEPGVSGYSPTQPNLYTRDVFGVTNNGASQGIVTFTVPNKNAQDNLNFPGNNLVDVVSTLPFDQVNGQRLANFGGIDGITSLNGLRVLFYNTGVPNEVGYISSYYDEVPYDSNNPILSPYIQPTVINIAGTTHIEYPYSVTPYDIDPYDGNYNWVTLDAGFTTNDLTVNQTIVFNGGTGGLVPGQVYFITAILSSTEFVVSTSIGGDPVQLTTSTVPTTALIGQGLYEEGFYTNVSENFYRVTYVGDPSDPVIRLLPDGLIPIEQKITATFGTQWIARNFYRNQLGVITLIPYITAPLDTLYYQDGTSPNKVGIIRIIDSNLTNTLNVETDIIGKKNYTSTNGIVFTNGLKVQFDGDVIPSSYLQGEYYVEGVGTAIKLISTETLVSPETYTLDTFSPYDILPYDIGNYDSNLNVPVDPDYITIARDSLSLNPWSRSNRWFHIDVINDTATYNNNPNVVTEFATSEAKAKRPIIEFYPNLKLYQSGSFGKKAVDFIDTRVTDALSIVAGKEAYYPDVEVYTGYDAVIAATSTTPVNATSIVVGTTYEIATLGSTNWNTVAGTVGQAFVVGQRIEAVAAGTGTGTAIPLAESTTITIPNDSVEGTFQVGMYVGDSTALLPTNSQITNIAIGANTVLTIAWPVPQNIPVGTSIASVVGTDTTVNNYALFPESRIIFAADNDINVRNKIYVANFSQITPSSPLLITLTEAEDGDCLPEDQTVITRGYNNRGLTYYFDGSNWLLGQKKLTVNQAPFFDVFDENGISFSDPDVYRSTSFAGCTLFQYGLGAGADDPILAFPIRYSSFDNVGDISFDVTLNSQTFDYVTGFDPITQKVNTGYVHNFVERGNYVRELGWQTAVAPSTQYQIFEFEYDPEAPNSFVCDVGTLPALAEGEKGWPRVQVYLNNVYQSPENYVVNTGDTSTVITLTNPTPEVVLKTPVQVMLLSNQVSQNAYYSIPINLNNNPLNQEITTANIGDIRTQYQDIYINAPGTQGIIFGANNFRDLGNLVPYGTKIIQNSASLVLPGTFLRKQNHNLFDALLYNSREYVKFKQLLVDTVQNTDYVQRFTPAQILDSALDQITDSKSDLQAFFWSDMLPSKAPYRSNTYTFNNDLDNAIYPLTQVYNFDSANYNGVLVYLNRTINGVVVEKQLIKGTEYIISDDSPSLTVIINLLAGDKITVKEYNQTYGSFVPNTPTKLGLYPAFEPNVVLDSDYTQPTYFIKGHDGSYTKLYGEYNSTLGVLTDFRDQALLEFERRIYNNLKLSTTVPIERYEVVPGYFRDPTYSWEEFLQMYSQTFLNWVGQNRVDYKTQFFNKNMPYTYNYSSSANKLDNTVIKQGYWRGVYEYFYDTTTPNETPWQMLGFSNMPSWWTERYGPAPYTSENLILWGDLELGYIWNGSDEAAYIVPELARPGLTNIIPVNTAGTLVSPFISIVGNYNPNSFQKDWKVGDDGPVEFSYRRSSTYPFDLIRLFALTRPAEFFNLAVDLDNYKYNEEFNQYLVNNRSHLVINDIEVYGNGTAKTSYINWIVDYEKQLGIDATNNITTLLDNLDVRLVYRLAGYSDKTLLKFYVEKSTPNSRNASLLIPDESYQVLLYDNQPFDRISYSGVIIQQVEGAWTVYGNAQNFAYFKILEPSFNGNYNNLTIDKLKVKLAKDYTQVERVIPYGTIFYSAQEVSQFLMSYGAWLESKGMVFDEIESGLPVTWQQMAAEFLYWTQTGWEVGSVITLNPSATVLKVDKESTIVQPLTIQQQNFILNQNLYPIQINDLCVQRDGTIFRTHTLNQGDAMSYAQFNVSNFEHGIVFDNVTVFNDIIYNLITGLRQNRISVRGTKSAEWNGTVNASGFIINQDNVQEWSRDIKYTKGEIVLYKNKYWTALKIIEPSNIFNERDWKETDYDNIQKGMLPNSSTRSYESTIYYDTNRANLEQDADLLGYSLIGYRPRDYLAIADLTDVTQVNVYKNLIKNKGTRNAVEAFRGANLPQGGIDYEVYENWAIKQGEYGGVLNENFVEFKVNQDKMTGNPSIVSLTEGIPTPGSMQEVPLYSLYNYGRPIENPNVLNTIADVSTINTYPDAGYVNFNDVKMASYFYAGLPRAVNGNGKIVPISNFYVRDYLWIANFKERWDVYSFKPVGEIIEVRANLNNTATVTFSGPHNLNRLQPLAIINFAPGIDGYYIVTNVVNLNEVVINLTVINSLQRSVTSRGIGLTFQSQRVSKPSEIAELNLTEADFSKNTVWVDENDNGQWAVYRKSLNYQYNNDLERDDGVTFGSAVAYTSDMGYLIGDSGLGKVYRYGYNELTNQYDSADVLTSGASFGSKIAYSNNIYVISEPTGTPRVHIYTLNDSALSDDILVYQTAISAPMGVTNWGHDVAISDDTNWIYISAINNNKVYVYRRDNIELSAGYLNVGETYTITEVGTTDWTTVGAIESKVGITFIATGVGTGTGKATQVTYKYSTVIDGSTQGLVSGDNFGFSVATDYNGDTLVVGAPNKDYNASITDWGTAYVYQRTVQNIEAQYNTIGNEPQIFTLAWTPTAGPTRTGSAVSSNYITASGSMVGYEDYPVVFSGNNFGVTGISPNTVYYISQVSGSTFTIKTSRSASSDITLDNDSGLSFGIHIQVNQLYVSVNGVIVQDNNYGTIADSFVYTGTVRAGDIINVSDNQFRLLQSFTSEVVDKTNITYSYDLDITSPGSEILVGSPFEIDSMNREGAVYRYTNGGAKYGVVIGTSPCNVLGDRKLLINGYLVFLTAGNAEHIANIINTNQITNVQASATADNKLIIQVVDTQLSLINEKLLITAFEGSTLSEMGINVFTKTQVIHAPREYGPTQFGKTIKFNEFDNVVISAPSAIRFEGTTFDFVDDENLNNDTIFDNNATRFVDTAPNAGAVYMFDYLNNYQESLLNPGKFVYAQAVNSPDQDYGSQPLYGTALDFNSFKVVIGTPNYKPVTVGGQVTVYNNSTGLPDWTVYRESAPIVNIEKIQNAQLFSAETNNTLINLDYIDPLQGKLLGAVRQNIDYVQPQDPGKYNSDLADQTGYVWGSTQVGKIWFNTNNVRWLNYHQDDVVYNSKYWGSVFPGSDVAVYTWTASFVPPSAYEGPGVPYNVNLYSVSSVLNSSNVVIPVYYFWVRNSNIISRGKTLSDTIIASYIANPRNSGIAYFTPLLPNTFGLYNSGEYINANDSVLHIGFATGESGDVAHQEFALIRENNPDDFLPGLPSSVIRHGTDSNLTQNVTAVNSPYGLYDRLLDSLSGVDEAGSVVPNPFLPKAVQSGILARPRQSFFFNRYLALKNYLLYANEVLAQFPIAETRREASFLFTSGEFYDTTDYWEYVNWWATGYDNNTKSILQVPIYADLSALTVPTGSLVTVEQNGDGKFEVYRYDGSGVWTRVGLENGTIRFKTYLWNYSEAKLGFGGDFFDTTSYDDYPSEPTRNIVRALNEQIYIDELVSFRNKSLILLFEYIQSETDESQNYLPWLSKTSLVDVAHTIRELRPIEVFKTDNQEFLEGYINEVKPYHVVVKEFLFKYTGEEVFEGNITDFDLPSKYNSQYEKFISPQLTYGLPNNEYEYSDTDDIWQQAEYSQWFQNKGVSITGQTNYKITVLTSYLNLSTNYILVDNAQGFPINGVIRLGEEEIAYSFVDRSINLISGLQRGFNGTPIKDHIPGEDIYIDLPAVLVLDGGRGYIEPPKVTAFIDTDIYPEPTSPAVLEAVMSLDSVLQVNVIDPGQGYAVLPEIVIDPAVRLFFSDTDINSTLHTIRLYAPNLRTGDLIQYRKSENGATVGKLVDGQWYYINVLENTPTAIIGLYSSYGDAVKDQDRIRLFASGTGDTFSLNVGAKASAITAATPVRENNITLRFDRTTYRSQVQDWRAGAYYGSFFAGSYFNSESVSSSSIQLESTQPPIESILASAQGVAFEIVDVTNDRQLDWSTFQRFVAETVDGDVTDPPEDRYFVRLAYSSTEPNASGSTIGFYLGMPIKFIGATVSNIVEGQTYYVAKVINDSDFSISTTDDGANVVVLTDATVSAQGLSAYAAKVTDTAILTVNYPGILEVTATQANTNKLTVPLSLIGTGGTSNFYINLPIFFTGNDNTLPNNGVFGGVVENQVYYITTVVDDQTFTMSEKQDPLFVNALSASTATSIVTVESTEGFAVNDAIIFNTMVVAGTAQNTFGNIVSGTTYYVSEVVSDTELKISTLINGAVFDPGNVSAASNTSALLTSQKDTVTLTTATGSMNMNVSLPVSPGQVNGQLFTLYGTSQQYPNINSYDIEDEVVRTINATIAGVNRVAISEIQGGTDNFYVNMPIRITGPAIGGLATSTTYFVTEYSGEIIPDPLNPGEFIQRPNIEVEVTTTSSSTNRLTCDTTDSLYVGMPIVFSGVSLGGLVIGQEYFVQSIPNSTQFTISDTQFGSVKTLTTSNGIMVGTGDAYIVVSLSAGGPEETLSDSAPGSTSQFTQYVTSNPTFDISYILGGYRAIITNGGSGFVVNNTITISGALVGGSTPANDVTLTVNTIGSNGEIIDVICAGTVPGTASQYYLKVRSPNELEVYSNPLMTVPVTGVGFEYTGFTTATVTGLQSSNDALVVADTSIFNINDAIVVTGDMSGVSPTNIVFGETYYILDILSSTEITLTTVPGSSGNIVNVVTNASTNFTIAKAGSFALLPEPFYFNQSIVKFNGRVYVCVISNNDDEFVFGKWELLDSGDRRLNALDRTIGYYQPTVNMPGADLTQLFEGITYPNSIYLGNPFEPVQQFELDTILQDQPFYPTEVDVTSALWNGTHYLASANLPDYSAVLGSASGENWAIAKLTNVGIGATDIIYAGNYYVMTSTNSATPIFRSNDGITWTTNGYFTPYGTTPYDDIPYDMTSISIASLSLNSVAYALGYWVAVGENIVRSDDTYIWRGVTAFNPSYNNQLYSVTAVDIPAFEGFVTVGKGKRPDYSTGVTLLVDTNLILYSPTGEFWTDVPSLTSKGLHGVASNGSVIVAVGESGVVYYSNNGANWEGANEVGIISVNSSTNELNVTNTAAFAINDTVRFTQSFSSLTAGTTYYVEAVVSSTQLRLKPTIGGTTIALTPGPIPNQTLMYAYDATDPTPATLRDVIYNSGVWIAVGDSGVIKTSPDYLTWTTVSSGTLENLNGISYNIDDGVLIAVGDNNTVLLSQDNGVTWTSGSLFTVAPTVYDVKGADFPYGYGPEELVPGVVTDNLAMIVTTRPGTTWPVTEYSHTGYNVVSVELEPTNEFQTEYSFSEVVQYPAQVYLQVLDATTLLGTTLATTEYSVDWVNKSITLNTPLLFSPQKQKLRLDVYEIGNGNQLVKSNTDTDPIRENAISGYQEIYLNCNYSENIFNGSGVLRTGSHAIEVEAIATDASTNRITCVNVSDFTINQPITFQGVLFGGVQEEVVYYVKTISLATNSITISATYNAITGIAGPALDLTTATGSMFVNIQTGNGTVWTDPLIYHNGQKLVYGVTGIVTRTRASNNGITTNTTGGLIVGTPIVFCQCMFGNDIVPFQTYYIASIIDSNEFTISDTQGGPIKTLSNGTGGARFVTNDYAFGIQPNGTQAMIIFANNTYDIANDYLVYSVFGESEPTQYGYTIPETEEFAGDGSTSQFNLNYYNGGDNPYNAIVEINGVRQTISQYTIDANLDTLTFISPPPANSTVSITTFNDTERQYLTTQYGITGTPGSAFISLTIGTTTNTVGTFDQDTPSIQAYDQGPGDPITTTTAGDFNTGVNYTIVSVGTTDFTLIGAASNTPGVSFTATGPGTGTGTAYATVEVTYDEDLNWLTLSAGDTSVLNVNDSIIFTGTTFGGIVAGRTYYVLEIWNSTEFVVSEQVGGSPVQLTNASGSMSATANGLTVASIINITNSLTPPIATTFATATSSVTNEITVDSVSGFIVNQPVLFKITSTGSSFGGILTDGTVYFVDTIDIINNRFTIKDYQGNLVTLSNGAGNMFVEVGGTPAVRITTAIQHALSENTLVRLDGISGSVELNNNVYYAKIIDEYVFDIYTQPYDPLLYAVNYPVTTISTYTGGGYAWRAGLFYIITSYASETEVDGKITVDSTANLVEGTPVVFTQVGSQDGDTITGGLIQGTEYYVKQIFSLTKFDVSATRNGPTVALTAQTNNFNVTQWEQVNVDRLWVTVNGLRVPASKLRVNESNEVSILTEIIPGDEVIMTSMIPHSTPDEEVYINFVSQDGEGTVYRANTETRTWLTQPVYDLSTEIFVNDVTRLTDVVVQNVTAPVAVDGYYYIGLTADKRIIAQVNVVNNTTSSSISSANYEVIIEELSPILKIKAGAYITAGDSLTITTLEGNTILVNGEQIRFGSVNFATNSLGQLQRGANGTSYQTLHAKYSEVYGLLTNNELASAYYTQTWNSKIFNPTLGDPLQISETVPAQFLHVDIT